MGGPLSSPFVRSFIRSQYGQLEQLQLSYAMCLLAKIKKKEEEFELQTILIIFFNKLKWSSVKPQVVDQLGFVKTLLFLTSYMYIKSKETHRK